MKNAKHRVSQRSIDATCPKMITGFVVQSGVVSALKQSFLKVMHWLCLPKPFRYRDELSATHLARDAMTLHDPRE
jgi:hypothetical protein